MEGEVCWLLPFATALFSSKTWNAPGAGLLSSCIYLWARQFAAIGDSLAPLFWHDLRFSIKENLFTQGGAVMHNRESQCSAPAVVLALLGGAVVGVVAGLLLAPKSGEEARRALKGYARKTEEEVLERAKEARAALDETIDHGARFIAEKTADVEAAVKAGRETMKEKMDKCCN
jgi:gas vesicle protein